jgi:fused signal recognition particle receptor
MSIFSKLRKAKTTAVKAQTTEPAINKQLLNEQSISEQSTNEQQPTNKGFFTSLIDGLKRTRTPLVTSIAGLFSGFKKIDSALLEALEAQLLQADFGVAVTSQIIVDLKEAVKQQKSFDGAAVKNILKKHLEAILLPCENPLKIPSDHIPFVVLAVGVNGTGKTTTIGKLAHKLQADGKKVMLAAGDTFRAAAIEQLKVWGTRSNSVVIAQQSGADSAAVVFDALQAARARGIDVLIADTAGRLHTQHNLMDELKKVKRTLQKIDSSAPHEVLLVLDATIGQNALVQAVQFNNTLGITGICLTKLDGTAKGGIIFAIASQLKVPIRFVGVGEGIDDLKVFDAHEFVEALLL